MHSSILWGLKRNSPASLVLDAGDALVGSTWLPRTHGRWPDLCISSIRKAPFGARGRSVPTAHLAGSIQIFRAFYAWCIELLGLESAARLLTLRLYRLVPGGGLEFCSGRHRPRLAWLAVAFLLIVAGDYGGSGVFRILDPFLTARLPAEALIITALVCHPRGMKRLALLLAFAALFVHPLMALPGLLLIICLRLPIRGAPLVRSGAFSRTSPLRSCANLPTTPPMLTVMDAPWREVVRERSQFLFLQLWSFHDWDVNTLPFISLGSHQSR